MITRGSGLVITPDYTGLDGPGALRAGAGKALSQLDRCVRQQTAREMPRPYTDWTGRPIFEMINVMFQAFSDCVVGFGLPSFPAKRIMEDSGNE